MTASRDIQNARPHSQHRSGGASTASSVPGRSSYPRPHAHSVSLGSLNPGHRVSRRKSSSSMAGVNIVALTAVAKEGGMDVNGKHFKPGSVTKYTGGGLNSAAGHQVGNGKDSSAVVDGPSLSSMAADKSAGKNRGRRASEGSRVSKGERQKSSAGELRCDKCGKTYKHGSCLSKHLWEHTPQWALTSKLLISKHQQVQLLEAASVLVTMNQDAAEPANFGESAIQHDSDLSSDSPTPSGASDARDEDEFSSRTSTPSLEDSAMRKGPGGYRVPKREDSYSSAFSRSYQSAAEHPLMAASAPTDHDGFSYYRQWSSDRPSTAHSSSSGHYMPSEVTDAAEGLLHCRLGSTPRSGPVHLGNDIPPIPEIPAEYAHMATLSHHSPYTRMEVDRDDVGVVRPPTRGHDDDDEGVFGRME